MLRVKRNVQAQYSQVHHNDLALLDQQQATSQANASEACPADPLAAAEKALKEEEEEKKRLELKERALEEQLYLKKKKELDEAELAQAEEEFRKVMVSLSFSS